MKLILLKRVEKLGNIGDAVDVKMGYARNYLLPQKKAIRATKENIALFEERRAHIVEENLKHKEEAEIFAQKLVGTSVTLIRQASETGHLYGSIRPQDIASLLSNAGLSLDKNKVSIEKPIKTLGMHTVRLVLHPEVFVNITANIAQSEEEAYVQEEKFRAKQENPAT